MTINENHQSIYTNNWIIILIVGWFVIAGIKIVKEKERKIEEEERGKRKEERGRKIITSIIWFNLMKIINDEGAFVFCFLNCFLNQLT